MENTKPPKPQNSNDTSDEWQYLAPRPESRKKQFFVKGHRLTVTNVWFDMLANERAPQEAAENWNLPLEAIEEIIRYCEANEDLIELEADRDNRLLDEHGLKPTPEIIAMSENALRK